MVILTLTCSSGDEMVYFDKPLVVERIALKSAVWNNSWYNLTEPAKFLWKENGKTSEVKLAPGFYYYSDLKRVFIQTASGGVCTLSPLSLQIGRKLKINKIVWFSRNLYELLSMTDGVEGDTGEGLDYVLLSPGTYSVRLRIIKRAYVYCDLVDPHDSLICITSSTTSRPSNLLACVKTGESRFGSTQFSPANPTSLKVKWGCHAGVRLTARNDFGDIIDFNGLEIQYVLELDVANSF